VLFVFLALAIALVLATMARARPLDDGGDYSDDFAAPREPPAEGEETAPVSTAASGGDDPAAAAAAALAASAAAAREGDMRMRASQIGFAGVRFGDDQEEQQQHQVVAAATASPLLAACAAERQEYCAKVRVHRHDGRLMRCLASRAGSGGFSDRCRAALAARVHGRQVDWRLDPRLARACDADAARLCTAGAAAAQAEEEEHGAAAATAAASAATGGGAAQLRCLARHASSSGVAVGGLLSSGCEAELSRASHAFLFLWAPGAPLTAPCDADVQRLCLVADELLAQTPGAVDACLVGVHVRMEQHQGAAQEEDQEAWRRDDRKLAPACAALVRLSSSGRSAALKREFSASLALYSALHTSVEALERAAGGKVTLARRDAGGAKIVGLTPEGVGAAVGGSIAGALLLGGVVGLVAWCCVRSRRGRKGLMADATPSVGAPVAQKAAAVFLQVPPPPSSTANTIASSLSPSAYNI
jgi:hypothetical protein